MQYSVLIFKDTNSAYSVIIPDLPGCFSAGESIEEAILNAHEAIECHIEGLLIDNDPIPAKESIELHLKNPDLKGAIVAMVDIDLTKLSGKTTRINISVPERFLKKIDAYTSAHGGNRSAFLVDAAMSYMTEHSSR